MVAFSRTCYNFPKCAKLVELTGEMLKLVNFAKLATMSSSLGNVEGDKCHSFNPSSPLCVEVKS